MNILLTGGTGFVGNTLYQRLQTLPEITPRLALRAPNPTYPDAIIVGAINQNTDWCKALQGIDTIIHLAAYAHVTESSLVDRQALYETNVLGTQNLIQQALGTTVNHFIFISSIGAMATRSQVPLSETSCCCPSTLYGRSKLQAEQGLIQLSQDTPMDYTILRPPLVYGPGNPGNMARLQKLVGLPIPLPLGSIKNRRSFIYVHNLVDAILACIHHPQAVNQTFLVSDGQDLSTPDLIRLLSEALNRPSWLLPVPPALLRFLGQLTGKTATVERLLDSLTVDSSKIRSLLNWTPPYTTAEGIQATADWYLQSRSTF